MDTRAIHLNQLTDLPTFLGSLESKFITTEKQIVIRGFACFVVVPLVQRSCGVGGVALYLNHERESHMLCTSETLEKLVHLLESLPVLGNPSTFLKRLLEKLPMQEGGLITFANLDPNLLVFF